MRADKRLALFGRSANVFKIKTLDEAAELSRELARQFPAPEKIWVGLHELLINAIEHGNLGIGFDAKASLLRTGRWAEEIERRLKLPEYADRKVTIRFARNERKCRLKIEDQGTGFDWEKQTTRMPLPEMPNGRGLIIARASGFDCLEFNRKGNAIVCETGGSYTIAPIN